MATGQLAPVIHYLRKVTTPAAAGDVPDAELLSRFARQRDEAAFTALVRRRGPMTETWHSSLHLQRLVRLDYLAWSLFRTIRLPLPLTRR